MLLEQFLLLSTIFCFQILDFYVKIRIRFSPRDKPFFRGNRNRDNEGRLYYTYELGIMLANRSSKSRKENPQKLNQLSSRSHPRHLVGKRTAQKDITIDTTSDSQVNSNFPNRWSPASLTFNNYFYLFLYLYIT